MPRSLVAFASKRRSKPSTLVQISNSTVSQSADAHDHDHCLAKLLCFQPVEKTNACSMSLGHWTAVNRRGRDRTANGQRHGGREG
jgi:hypothetical protein